MKRDVTVMICLGGDISFDGLDVGIAHRESGVPSLPGKPPKIRNRLVDPSRRTEFDLANDIGQRGFMAEPGRAGQRCATRRPRWWVAPTASADPPYDLNII